jgi:hypothetical protein
VKKRKREEKKTRIDEGQSIKSDKRIDYFRKLKKHKAISVR